MKITFQILLFVILFCGAGAVRAQGCDPTPPVVGVGLTDLNKIPVFSISPDTAYFIKVCAKAPAVCVDITGGGHFDGGLDPLRACNDVTFPSPYTVGDVGAAYFRVLPDAPGVPLTGTVTPWDSCGGWLTESATPFSLPGTSCEASVHNYRCGYALPGYQCNNGRRSTLVQVKNILQAVSACRAAQFPGYTDRCYILNSDGFFPQDVSGCFLIGGSWRSGNNCCNFKGSLSCP